MDSHVSCHFLCRAFAVTLLLLATACRKSGSDRASRDGARAEPCGDTTRAADRAADYRESLFPETDDEVLLSDAATRRSWLPALRMGDSVSVVTERAVCERIERALTQAATPTDARRFSIVQVGRYYMVVEQRDSAAEVPSGRASSTSILDGRSLDVIRTEIHDLWPRP